MRPSRAEPARSPGWVLVLPVKHADQGKSRLQAPAGTDRAELARAIAVDALTAVRRCPWVVALVVVTADPVVAAVAAGAGDDVVDDPGEGLAGAVAQGLARAGSRWPACGSAILLADLPALTADELGSALRAAAVHSRAFVPDVEGLGTVLLTALPGEVPQPSFGAGSAARHEQLGAHRLDLDLPTLRRDVDTADDLRAATCLGLGVETSRMLRRSSACPVH